VLCAKHTAVVALFLVTSPSIYAETPDAPNASNQSVLDDWKAKSGQSGTISKNDGSEGALLEWHGEVTTDAYNVDTKSADPGRTLSGLQEGSFQLTNFQGDLRRTEASGDVNYIQGGVSVTNDRATQTLYTTQTYNLQVGRAGPGYQIAVGDVIASFSQLGSNLGLRGIYGARQIDAATLSGYTGMVSNTWESLLALPTINSQRSRTQFLREVSGGKIGYQVDNVWEVFGTAQTYQDIESSINNRGGLGGGFGQKPQEGSTGTFGAKYQTDRALVTAEAGYSKYNTNQPGTSTAADNALLLDASYRWQTAGLRAGYHDLGVQYTSLAQTVAPGIREAYVGGDWYILPTLSYGADIRESETRFRSFFGGGEFKNTVDLIVNRLSYSFTKLPGLNVSLQDMRNWGKNETSTNRNSNTLLSGFYAIQQYSASLSLGVGEFKNSVNPDSDSANESIQVGVGRQILSGEIKFLPEISMSVQLNGGYSRQRIANGTQTATNSQGISLNSQSKTLGLFSLYLQNQDTTQPNGGNPLNTKIINLNWNKPVSEALAFKAYVRAAFRNHGVQDLFIDEKIVGAQLDYLW